MTLEQKIDKLEQESQDMKETMSEDRILLKQIHAAIIGDAYGNFGLAKRVEAIETWRIRFVWISGASSAGSFLAGLLFKSFWAYLTTHHL